MVNRLRAYIKGLEQAETLEDLKASIGRASDLFEMDHVLFLSFRPVVPVFWVSSLARIAVPTTDLAVDTVPWVSDTVEWRDLDGMISKNAAYLLGVPRHLLPCHGLSVAVFRQQRLLAIMLVGKDCRDQIWADQVSLLKRDLRKAAYATDSHLAQKISAKVDHAISAQELRLLKLLADGHSLQSISDVCGLGPIAVDVISASACFKLDAADVEHAYQRAMTLGLFDKI
ncbi:helix-turn-helix transcriptional regulator [Pseudaestuariivita rosea]|uniref:helix-turn-helix transcriptional regulator n=1 Tax=Pseudaestuariivita rosea TaxID=2763263 RepID=UPI001ABB4F88|nr:hypothetical protein [Pseudaestuariivita rosea]